MRSERKDAGSERPGLGRGHRAGPCGISAVPRGVRNTAHTCDRPWAEAASLPGQLHLIAVLGGCTWGGELGAWALTLGVYSTPWAVSTSPPGLELLKDGFPTSLCRLGARERLSGVPLSVGQL